MVVLKLLFTDAKMMPASAETPAVSETLRVYVVVPVMVTLLVKVAEELELF